MSMTLVGEVSQTFDIDKKHVTRFAPHKVQKHCGSKVTVNYLLNYLASLKTDLHLFFTSRAECTFN